MKYSFPLVVATLLAIPCPLLAEPLSTTHSFKVEVGEDWAKVSQGDSAVATYLFQSGAKPVIWPLIGPSGAELTRGYPLRDATKDERSDHVHHRSFWFTHGEVNGIDFWSEKDGGGQIKHIELVKADGGKQAVIATANDWLSPNGDRIMSDRRRFTFGGDAVKRWIDCDFTLVASAGEVHFGDTKEGSFGIRVAGTMKVDAKQGGTIENSNGETNKTAWGTKAAWCDYHGPVAGDTVGIAILNHPSSFNFPCRWHVRTYGLFAANPFGHHHFVGEKKATDGVRLAKGESLQLRYRVILHEGTTEQAQIAKQFAAYEQLKIQGPERIVENCLASTGTHRIWPICESRRPVCASQNDKKSPTLR